MIKRFFFTGLLAVLISCMLPLVNGSGASAQDNSAGNISYTSSLEADFPLKLLFKISAESSSEITDIRLHYSTNMESFAPVTSEAFIVFEPDTTIEAQWSWDMRKTGGLPPGTTIKYWWTIKDADGNIADTTQKSIRFDDDRYDWQSISENNLTIYWYEGKQSFAEELMSSAQQALVRLEQNTGAYLKKPAEIYVYGNTQDLQGAMVFPQEWTGGVAFTNYNIIAIGIEPGNIGWGKGAVTHELTHLVVAQMTFNPYSGMPVWLDEGLAMYNEGPLDIGLSIRLDTAVKNDNLITVKSLSSPFSTDTETAYLSYAQSYSIVEFLVAVYGQDSMLDLLMTFNRGSGYDEAIESVYGFDMQKLNSLWRDYVRKQHGIEDITTSASLPVLTR